MSTKFNPCIHGLNPIADAIKAFQDTDPHEWHKVLGYTASRPSTRLGWAISEEILVAGVGKVSRLQLICQWLTVNNQSAASAELDRRVREALAAAKEWERDAWAAWEWRREEVEAREAAGEQYLHVQDRFGEVAVEAWWDLTDRLEETVRHIRLLSSFLSAQMPKRKPPNGQQRDDSAKEADIGAVRKVLARTANDATIQSIRNELSKDRVAIGASKLQNVLDVLRETGEYAGPKRKRKNGG